MRISSLQFALGLTSALVLAACGGGGGSMAGNSVAPTAAQAAPTALSSGTVTAFGSVFVNGHEFNTTSASVIDDDAGTTTAATTTGTTAAGLAVGMQVDVVPAASSTTAAPVASEIHVHPLARGYVDYSDSTAGTLSVMGQTVAVGTATIKDARACVSATTGACTAIVDQTGFVSAATGGNTTCYQATGGSFTCGTTTGVLSVQVYGFLATSATAGAGPIIQASLVRVVDPGTTPVFHAEGPLSAVNATEPKFTMGGLQLTSSAACTTAVPCNFAVGNVVTARGKTLVPVTTGGTAISVAFTPDVLKQRKVAALTAGSSVEVEGKVASVDTTAKSFVLQGLTIEAGTLTLPAVGDVVEVAGTVNADLSIAATAISIEHSAAMQNNPFLIADTLKAGAVSGTAAPFSVGVLGTTVTVNAMTRLEDRTVPRGTSSAFNATTFATYINALSTPPSVAIQGYLDPTTNTLVATSFAIVPANNVVALGGKVASISGSGVTLTVDGVTVTSVASGTGATTVVGRGHNAAALTLASIVVGDYVVAQGTETGTTTVTGLSATAIQDFGMQLNDRFGD